jgi:hypothetical protein
MRMMAIAGLMITFPAIVTVFFFFGRPAMYAALASFAINFLPFLAAIWFLRNRKDQMDDFEH